MTGWGSRRSSMGALALMTAALRGTPSTHAQQPAATPPAPAVTTQADPGQARARNLLDAMLQAMGGSRWLNRGTERLEGKTASFYKSAPSAYETQFEAYIRVRPFAERIVIVSRMGVLIPTTKRDVAEVWTPENGYEVSYHGRKELPRADVEDFQRRQTHSLDVILRDWLNRPDTLLTFEGSAVEERRLVDKVSVLTAQNDAVTLALDKETHLPLSRTFQFRDATYKDFNTDVERYDNWHMEDGLMTPLTITRYRNGDLVSQRFLTRVQYGLQISPDVFDPDRPLNKK